MKTLYDLLGALPDDDADELRAAFRRAAKANHPDNNPDNPEAAERFRKIVRANAILSDGQQRAAYDRLLETARRQQGPKPRRSTLFGTAQRLAADAVASAVVSVVLIGGYLLYKPADRLPLASAEVTEASAPKPAQAPIAKAAELSDAHGQAEQHDKHEIAGADAKLDVTPHDAKEPAEPDGVAPAVADITTAETSIAPAEFGTAPAVTTGIAAASASASPALGFGTKDAQYYRDRGIQAYRIGDFYIALVNFDLAINLDPNLPDSTSIARSSSIAWATPSAHFSDVAEAKRIEALNRTKTPSVANAPQR